MNSTTKIHLKIKILLFLLFVFGFNYGQTGIPVYSDYLSDNYYLIHPSMAGAANCAKVRVTARKQWFGQEDAPSLQTASFNGKIGEKSGVGVILFNDKNGYHSEKGMKVTYAHHIMFSRDKVDLNELSFGISVGFFQNQLDETSFDVYDPIVVGDVQKNSYFSTDFGVTYNYSNFYVHATVQGLVETNRNIYTEFKKDNFRKYLLSAGYVFKVNQNIMLEPSMLFFLLDKTKKRLVDFNLKAYKEMGFGKVWAGLSYRRSFDSINYDIGGGILNQKLQYITPIFGVNYKKFMVAYTYSNVTGDIKFNNGGYHQITLGIDLFCKKERYKCACPAVN